MIKENYIEIDQVIKNIVKSASKLWTENSKAISKDFGNKKVLINKIKKSLKPIEISFPQIDLIVVEIFFKNLSIFYSSDITTHLRIGLGKNSKLLLKDLYKDLDKFDFFKWRNLNPLRIQILNSISINEENKNEYELITTYSNLINNKYNKKLLLQNLIFSKEFDINEKQIAMRILLKSTKYTQKLMQTENYKKRNLIYLPIFVGGNPVGGFVIFSENPLSEVTANVLKFCLEFITYKIKANFDLMQLENYVRDKVVWESAMIYIHRLYHDVQKPFEAIFYNLDSLAEQINYVPQIPMQIKEDINRLNQNFADFATIVSHRPIGLSINELKEVAKKEAKKINIQKLLNEILVSPSLRKIAIMRNIEISGEILNENINEVKITKYLVVEVLQNLLSNAVKNATSKVDILVDFKKLKYTNKLIFYVIDNGKGIDKEIIENLRSNTIPSIGQNTKLGLHIVNFIVKYLLQGKIKFNTSISGTKAEFILFINE